jgi:hypothetical protein
MQQMIDVAVSNLLSPMVLFFLLGIIAVLVNSDLKVPSAFYTGYTMIILFTIGIKGGKEIRNVELQSMLPAIGAAFFLSIVMLVIAYVMLRKIYGYSLADSAAVSAHYGSVSAVTFIAGITFLEKSGIWFEPYVTALLVLMEGPAIIGAIVLYDWFSEGGSDKGLAMVFKEAFFGKSIFLLIGGIIIGMVATPTGLEMIKPLFGDLFYGFLCIFLLHLGMISTNKLREIKGLSLRSFTFAFILPLIGGGLGIGTGLLIDLSVGGITILATLSASASYIAAPAAVEQAIPEANSGLYIGSSLGLTLPFNLIVGIPLYYSLAVWLVG